MKIPDAKKKPKVEPVLSVEAKKAIKQKKSLSKQLKGLSLGGAQKQGIHRKLSSDSSEEEAMEVDQVGGKQVGESSKGIRKVKPNMTRAMFIEMKKLQKRMVKSGY